MGNREWCHFWCNKIFFRYRISMTVLKVLIRNHKVTSLGDDTKLFHSIFLASLVSNFHLVKAEFPHSVIKLVPAGFVHIHVQCKGSPKPSPTHMLCVLWLPIGLFICQMTIIAFFCARNGLVCDNVVCKYSSAKKGKSIAIWGSLQL